MMQTADLLSCACFFNLLRSSSAEAHDTRQELVFSSTFFYVWGCELSNFRYNHIESYQHRFFPLEMPEDVWDSQAEEQSSNLWVGIFWFFSPSVFHDHLLSQTIPPPCNKTVHVIVRRLDCEGSLDRRIQRLLLLRPLLRVREGEADMSKRRRRRPLKDRNGVKLARCWSLLDACFVASCPLTFKLIVYLN